MATTDALSRPTTRWERMEVEQKRMEEARKDCLLVKAELFDAFASVMIRTLGLRSLAWDFSLEYGDEGDSFKSFSVDLEGSIEGQRWSVISLSPSDVMEEQIVEGLSNADDTEIWGARWARFVEACQAEIGTDPEGLLGLMVADPSHLLDVSVGEDGKIETVYFDTI